MTRQRKRAMPTSSMAARAISSATSGERVTPDRAGEPRISRSAAVTILRRGFAARLHVRHRVAAGEGAQRVQLKLGSTAIRGTSAFARDFSTLQGLGRGREDGGTFFAFRHYMAPSARKF